ncbi:MAG: ABC transporter substrate-binding protein [Dehalococcoidia bacterium]|nr:ABC transporter substrate-binding protein [Dehalococcoidia bacterium]
MSTSEYWSRRLDRRSALRGVGVGIAGIAGAALFGCGGGGEQDRVQVPITSGNAFTGDALVIPPPAGKVGKDQVRLKPGSYDFNVPMSPAETDPLANGRYGGTLLNRYLDPPSMDFNRTLSCTINTTMDYTKNKLIRGVFGPKANPAAINIEPDLAEKWEVNPDQTVFTFHLRKGVKFHNVAPLNGREFTSADVKASIERYRAGGVQKDVWEPVSSIETPDAYTVKLTLSEPLADFPRNIAAWSHMDAREMLDDKAGLALKAVGTGPFIQQEWVRKERSIFAKNPEYFEKGLPFLDNVISTVQDDLAVLLAGFSTNNFVDYATRDRDDADVVMKKNPGGDVVMMKYTTAQGVNTSGFHFQMKNPKWQDVRIRRAFSLAIDRREFDLARYLGEGGGYSKGPIPWQTLYGQMPTLESQGPWLAYDPKQASQLLQAAGYSAANPIVADAPVWYGRSEYQQIMAPMFGKIPELKFNIRIVDNPTAVQMLNDRNFDDTMNVTWGPPSYSVDQVVYPWYHSKGGVNHASVNDPDMDALLVAQRREKNVEAQKEIWKKIERKYFDEAWQVWYPVGPFARTAWHNYMINYRPHGIGSFTCYANAQTRAVWLDEGAPNALAMPEFRDVAEQLGQA